MTFLESLLGKWGLALVGKAHGLDAGGYFQGDVGDQDDPKSISHEHTFGEDSPDAELLESTLAKLSQMVGRRLREHRDARENGADQIPLLGFQHLHAGAYAGPAHRISTSN